MRIIKALSLTVALLIPIAAIAAPAISEHGSEHCKEHCKDPASCCPGCPMCQHAK